jgi:superfamily II DNA helicase RecQ
MQNQVEGFRAAGIAAAALSSATSVADRENLLADICGDAQPTTKLLYVTPELLATEG